MEIYRLFTSNLNHVRLTTKPQTQGIITSDQDSVNRRRIKFISRSLAGIRHICLNKRPQVNELDKSHDTN